MSVGPLEQNIQATTASKCSHDTGADSTSAAAGGVVPAIIVVVLLLWGIALLLRWVVHGLLLLGIVTLLLPIPLSLLWVVALLGLAAAVVV